MKGLKGKDNRKMISDAFPWHEDGLSSVLEKIQDNRNEKEGNGWNTFPWHEDGLVWHEDGFSCVLK